MAKDEETPLQVQHTEPISMRAVKIRYSGYITTVFFLALFFRWNSDATYIFRIFPAMNNRCDGETFCLGTTFTYRISFALFTFFVLHALVGAKWVRKCLGHGAYSAIITGGWIFKTIALVLLSGVTLFIPFDFFTGYAYLALGLSVLFLIIQTIVLLSFVYEWNEKWMPADGHANEDDAGFFTRAAVCSAFVLLSIGIVLSALGYHWFIRSSCDSSEYSLHMFFLTFNVVFAVLSLVLAGALEGGSVLVSTFAFAYCALMTYSAIMSGSKDDSCNVMYTDPKDINFNTILSIALALAVIVRSSVSAGTSKEAFSVAGGDEEEEFNFTYYFLCFALGAAYLAMVLCSWEITTVAEHHEVMRTETSESSMWVKMGNVLQCRQFELL
eukprot:gene18198-28038_t